MPKTTAIGSEPVQNRFFRAIYIAFGERDK